MHISLVVYKFIHSLNGIIPRMYVDPCPVYVVLIIAKEDLSETAYLK